MFFRYLLISALSLSLDYSILLVLVQIVQNQPLPSAIFSYTLGAFFHYVLSRRFVFSPGWLKTKGSIEFGAFMLTSLFGIGITSLIILLNLKFAITNLLIAKTFAVVISFSTIYLLRKYFVFHSVINHN